MQQMFLGLVENWFDRDQSSYKGFLQELLRNNVELMNVCMNRLTRTCFSFFDVGGDEPERFYHGFVLGLLALLGGEFRITSNRERGFGRYDVMLESKDAAKRDAFILEFKVRRPEHEKSLEDTLASALKQIRDKNYKDDLIDRGIPADRIHCYGFAFEGKRVLVG
ncbi:MAG: PD-(D/E)XK nuclease domain-containing protein [Duodenibacillus sp.]|nr:PD-(D/E)XK nuclease domain-containing protein [Duodenibacillus sp.]